VTTPSGEVWTIRRRWIANRSVRWRGQDPTRDDNGGWRNWLDVFSHFDFPDDNPLAVIGLVIGAVLAALVLLSLVWFVVVPLLLLLFDVAILIVLTLIGVVARVVLRHPWEIEALGPEGRRLTWQVTGWQRSRRALTAIADHLSRGQIPPTNSPAFPPS
jgi:hypothetical protein